MQTLISQYSGMAPYQGIAHIDAVTPYKETRDGAMMREIGKTFCEAEMTELLGVALLHEHYMLHPQEVWHESASGGFVVSRPLVCAQVGREVHPMIYRLQPEGVVPMHWRAGVDPHAARVSAFLELALPSLLKAIGHETARFGIVRAPVYPEFQRGQIMREVSFAADRLLVNSWVDAPGESDGVIETTWYFAQAAGQVCVERTFCSPRTKCVKSGSKNGGGHDSVSDGHDRSSLGHGSLD